MNPTSDHGAGLLVLSASHWPWSLVGYRHRSVHNKYAVSFFYFNISILI